MTGWSAVNARTWSATATAATVPAVTFKNCRRDKNMDATSLSVHMLSMTLSDNHSSLYSLTITQL
jgi:hypothetical protein